jgi:hypothetical protein
MANAARWMAEGVALTAAATNCRLASVAEEFSARHRPRLTRTRAAEALLRLIHLITVISWWRPHLAPQLANERLRHPAMIITGLSVNGFLGSW